MNIKIELELEVDHVTLESLAGLFNRTSYVSPVSQVKISCYLECLFIYFGCYFLFQFECMSLIYLNIS